jgi:hypothetical protein
VRWHPHQGDFFTMKPKSKDFARKTRLYTHLLLKENIVGIGSEFVTGQRLTPTQLVPTAARCVRRTTVCGRIVDHPPSPHFMT